MPVPTDTQVPLDENGNPIDENAMAPPPGQVAPLADPNAPPQEDQEEEQPELDENGNPIDPNAQQQQAPTEPYYDDGSEPDGDEDYPDPSQVQKGNAMEPLVSDTGTLFELIEKAVSANMQRAQAPLIAKINGLVEANNTLATEIGVLKALSTEQMDVVKSYQSSAPVATETTPSAVPTNPESAGGDAVVKALGEKTEVDASTVVNPEGAPDLRAQATSLVQKARAIRDDIQKSYTGAYSKVDLVKALMTVQNGDLSPKAVSTLDTIVKSLA